MREISDIFIGRQPLTEILWEKCPDLSYANLSHANLNGVDLSLADLNSTDLRGANLTKADLTGADLTGADLKSANLFKADLRGAKLDQANLTWAKLSEANLSDATWVSCECGNAKEVRTLQLGTYPVVLCLPTQAMAIGCEQHTVEDWWSFNDTLILRMDGRRALNWWRINRPVLEAVWTAINAEASND